MANNILKQLLFIYVQYSCLFISCLLTFIWNTKKRELYEFTTEDTEDTEFFSLFP
ncbi:DUF1201 domain-containing protein [Bacteroides sp. OF03-11BH]|nr:DUF1201 domain-containing protein [Bacteroides sp. OF03-11BH]